MNNLNRVQNLFISDGTALPANNAALTTISAGDIAVIGQNMLALNPAGGDTITTEPSIYLTEGKTTTAGDFYVKRSMKIDGANVLSYSAKSYSADVRNTWTIGYDRKAATGTIEVNNDTNYNFSIRFKNDKWMYSERPELFNVNFTSAVAATQLSIATQIAGAINNGAFRTNVVAIVVGDGTGVYGLTAASNYGVEITSKDVNQFANTTYTPNQVYFSVQVNDASGFGTTTTCTETQAFKYGSGTYNQIRTLEKKCMGYEGGNINLRQWPIPELDYSSTSAYLLSSAIAETVTGTISEDKVTFSGTIAGKLTAGDKVELGGVNYEIKYFISTTVAILTSVLTAGLVGAAVKLRMKYDTVVIEFNDAINGPTGVVAVANKSVVIAVPAIDAGGAYNSLSTAGTNLKAILDGWMTTTPRAFANISI